MSEEAIREDLERHPDHSPIIDVDSHGNVVCLGWISPIYSWDDIERMGRELS